MAGVITPRRLRVGDGIRIISPASSLALVSPDVRARAEARLEEMVLKSSYGVNAEIQDMMRTAPATLRIADLHAAFVDPSVHLVMPSRGGASINQLLSSINWDLLAANPKMFCGFSDNTAFSNALFAITGMLSYSGPHYSPIGRDPFWEEHSRDYLARCLFLNEPFVVEPATQWQDDVADAEPLPTEGWWRMQEGAAEGIILGGHINTFGLLRGTRFMPSLRGTILFLEAHADMDAEDINLELQAIVMQLGFNGVRGLVFGRFQPGSGMSRELLSYMLTTKPELRNLPVLANVDFGHTFPMITFPIGGTCELSVRHGTSRLRIVQH